jgi:hypothetical protein
MLLAVLIETSRGATHKSMPTIGNAFSALKEVETPVLVLMF